MSQAAGSFTLVPKGPFSLEEAALFGFGQRHHSTFDGTMRLAFCQDGFRAQVGVGLTQEPGPAGAVHGQIAGVAGQADPEAVAAQVARVLSLDHDATGYVALGGTDPVLARLLAVAPGLRPPLFHSPYEAAFWVVLSSRRPAPVGQAWRQRLSAAAGATFDVAGQTMSAVPTPAAVLAMGATGLVAAAGIDDVRAQRLVGVADAAWEGQLEAAALAAMAPDAARRQLRAIPGIGPFYADLILIRSTGATDLFPGAEPRLLALMGQLYGLGGPASPAQAAELAEPWSPWRTWVAVLIRAAGGRLAGRALVAAAR